MEFYKILLPVALILFLAKFFGIFCKRLGLPQVIGMLLAGILVGLIKFIPNQVILDATSLEGLAFLAKIGVVLIMFSAGIETDLKQIKKTGFASLIITIFGVLVPLAGGFVVAAAFNGGFINMSSDAVVQNLFYGVILTATSVSVTVATLKEMGKLKSSLGTAIISAAIIDDVIGIIILSLILGVSGNTGSETTSTVPYIVIIKTVLFFVVAIIAGIAIRYIFKKLDKRWPHNRRLPIFGFAFCFAFAYLAEAVFGVADITGAFIAGLILSNFHSSDYIDRKVDINCYMIFGPVFFANIGINTEFQGMNAAVIGFGLSFVAVAILTKLIGCGLGAKLAGFDFKDSYRTGLGMMARAEVMLVCAQKGVENHIIDSSIMPFVLIVIIATSFLTPLLLKFSYRNDKSCGGDDAPALKLTSTEEPAESISGDVVQQATQPGIRNIPNTDSAK